MIAADPERSAALAEHLNALSPDWSQAPNIAALAMELIATATDAAFPGALIPSMAGGELAIYVIAATSADWRRLSPILLAFAGPTMTSFDGSPADLDQTDPVAAIATADRPAVTAALRLPGEPARRLASLRALLRVRETLARAPDLQREPSEPTSWLLSQFQDQLNVGARDDAFSTLRRLSTELRLDALNLRFLEVQALARFGEWQAIVDLPDFPSLCQARRPPSVTAILLQALFEARLAKPFQEQDKTAARQLYEEAVRPFAQAMLVLPAPPNLGSEGWRVFGLEAWIDADRNDLTDALDGHRASIGWLAEELEQAARPATPAEDVASHQTIADDEPPIDRARGALSIAESAGSLDAVARALASLKSLDPEQLKRLRAAEPFRSMLEGVDEVAAPSGVPANWIEWLEAAGNLDFTSALQVAQRGMDEWPPADALSDPVRVRAMIEAVEAAQNDPLAGERCAQALPFIIGWLRRDGEFPRTAATPIYSSLLTFLALGAARGRRIYESGQILVEALLGAGLDQRQYRDLLEDLDELVGSGLGVDMIYWLLEIIENIYRHATPDTAAREELIHKFLARIVPIFGRLSGLQRAAIRKLADELGWSGAGLADLPNAAGHDSFADRLAGKRIAIYTLTESSSRQAKETLEALAPDVIVDCNADHVGTARLKAMAEGADLFVMTSLSAKHAATDYIREHRGSLPLAYAQGRGFSSILRAVEEHLKSAA